MKKNLFAAFVVAILSICASNAYAQNYAVVDSEKIFKSIESYNTAVKELESQSKNYQQQIDQAFDELEKEYNTYQSVKASYSASQRSAAERKIISREEEITKFQEQVFGENGTIEKMRDEKLKPIQDKVFKIIDEYAAAKGLGLIIDIASNPIVLYYAPSADKTQEIIKIVNNN
ncbi:MAG: OmpH family outer membrane protein [Rikenellaceae bacterium]|nr:OmpH family outer membrane protein [Rikenellaceae bacterium]